MKRPYFVLFIAPIGVGAWSTLGGVACTSPQYPPAHTSFCRSRVVGDSEKIVCGDSKDRVLQKWGRPSLTSASHHIWHYQACTLHFQRGVLSRYEGQCALEKISNDSFAEPAGTSPLLYAYAGTSASLTAPPIPLCMSLQTGESFEGVLAKIGSPTRLERPHGISAKCTDISGDNLDMFSCDTMAFYNHYTTTPSDPSTRCTLYFKEHKVVHISQSCPISCGAF